ncbi:hypothetical protein R1flu_002782 [Riccia fluitans]|uniref:Uncharacterized protein n=1 Tax=Riccia fluitans TaxID=41844 RepID=A0ABD1YAH8_9MARC
MNEQEEANKGPAHDSISPPEEAGRDPAGGGVSGEKDVAREVKEADPQQDDNSKIGENKEPIIDNTGENENEYPTEASGSQGVSQASRKHRRGAKDIRGMEKEDVKKMLRRLGRSEDSEGSAYGSASSGSFDDSILNRRSIKTLQSSVIRDHDIPMKIAYEQLEELAANAEKVKYAIEKNRNLLNVQVRKSNARYLRAAFTAWRLQLEWQKTKRRDMEWAKGRWRKSLLSKALKESRTRQRSRSLQSTFTAWKSTKEGGFGDRVGKDLTTDDFYKKRSKNIVALALAAWQGAISSKKQGEEYLKRVRLSLDKQLLGSAFDAFVDGCQESKRMHSREKRASLKMDSRRLKKYFDAWVCFMQVQAQRKMIRLQEHIVEVEKENDRVRQENQRLTHVIDSGDWGRKRIAELLQAGKILSGERDALTRLLGRMQRQHGFALTQQKLHEEEMQELKHQILSNKPHMRNKLLVKGASSFNSLMKAMKDDVLKNGTDPELLYTIDKLAMDEVTVFPDGDLHVKNMTNFDKGKGGWPARQESPGVHNSEDLTKLTGQTKRVSTPIRTRARPKTPVQNISARQEVTLMSDSLKYPRPKTPLKGRALGRFDYTQRLDHGVEQSAPPKVIDGDRNVLVKGAGYKREISPRSNLL